MKYFKLLGRADDTMTGREDDHRDLESRVTTDLRTAEDETAPGGMMVRKTKQEHQQPGFMSS